MGDSKQLGIGNAPDCTASLSLQICLYTEQHQKMELGRRYFLHVKKLKKKNRQNHHQQNQPRSICQLNFSSAQSPRLIVKINCEARWLFMCPDAQISAASLWAAHPGLCPLSSCVPISAGSLVPGQAWRRPDAYFHTSLTNGLSGTTLLFSSNGVLFSLSSSLAHKRHIITTEGGEKKKKKAKALQITAIREPEPLGASGTAFYITVDTFFETITANNELGLTGL